MYKRPVVILILHFNLMYIKTQTVFDGPESEKNNFYSQSACLHNVSIKIINFLDQKQKYVKLKKSQGLLTLFKHQNHIAKNLRSTFDRIQNITESNVTENSLHLRNILEDIMREEMHQSKNYFVKNSSVNKFDREFAVFLKIFFDKALKISMNNVFKITNRVIKSPILKTPWNRTRDIKVWQPSSVERFDLFNNTRRIYKGKKAKIKDFPFLVSILINNVFTSAGSIISKDLVITAATGLNVLYKSDKYKELLSTVLVRVGSDYAVKEGSLVSVVDVIFHPGYDPRSLQNNLAIVRLVRRLRFSDKRKIQRILYDKKGVFKKNSMVIVLGWGAKDANKEVNLKQKVSVARLDLFDMDKCATMYSGFYVKESNFCAGFSDKGSGACNKDTGGPGIVGGELAGVISFGPSVCGQATSPTVFTKIANNVEWISSVINRERNLKLETTTTESETLTKPQTKTEPQMLFPIIATPAKPQLIPPKTTRQAQSQVSMQINTQLKPPPQLQSLRSRKPILRVPNELKFKQRLESHRFVTVTPENLSNISLPFSTPYFHPTLYSESTSQTTEIYPDQALILKEILKEIILSNTSVVDYILYGDILEDNVEAKYLLSTTEAVNIMHHQLVNKSLFLIEKPEVIIHPVRSKTRLSKPIVENSYESSSYDEGDVSSQIELLNSLFPQSEKPDASNYIVDDKKLVSIDHPDTSSTESSKKKVTNRLRSTILYGNSNEVADDFSSKLGGETRDDIDDYYDDESNVKTTKHKKTETTLTTISTPSMFKKYENVVFNLDDFDQENLDEMDRIEVDKYRDKKLDDKHIKQQYNKINSEENPRFKPNDRTRIGRDQYSGKNVDDKKQEHSEYHLRDNQQDEMDQMGRDLFRNNYKKKQEYKKNYTPNERVQNRDDKYDDKNFNDKGREHHKKYFSEETENKQHEQERMRKDSAVDDDNYSKTYQNKNKFYETPTNKNKGLRMGRHSAQNYDYDYDINIPRRTTETKYNAVGKAAAIPNDEFDFNYKDIMRNVRTYKNDRFDAYDKPDYNQRPIRDKDEYRDKISRYDDHFERKDHKRQDYKKSNDDDDFLALV